MKYISDRKFNITDFFLSHGQMLIRSSKRGDDDLNIDIVFFGVKFIQAPSLFNGISIKKTADKNLVSSVLVQGRIGYKEDQLFEIETDGEVFFIAAAFFQVYENNLNFNESSLGMINVKGREKVLFDSLDGA